MDKTILFWILFGALGFAFALAVQMRMLIALVLRRALRAWRHDLEDRARANLAVMSAASSEPLPSDVEEWLEQSAQHLRTTYPAPLNQLRTARRFSTILPSLMVVYLAIGRFALGVI